MTTIPVPVAMLVTFASLRQEKGLKHSASHHVQLHHAIVSGRVRTTWNWYHNLACQGKQYSII